MNGLLLAGAFSLSPAHSFGTTDHVYELAQVSMLPESLGILLRKSGTLTASPSSIEKRSATFRAIAAV